MKKGNRKPKIDPILEREKSVRTIFHAHHFPDLPGGEITIEGTSISKHCTHSKKEKTKDKNGLEKKEERALFKNIISAGEG